jgi:hypothetical protein
MSPCYGVPLDALENDPQERRLDLVHTAAVAAGQAQPDQVGRKAAGGTPVLLVHAVAVLLDRDTLVVCRAARALGCLACCMHGSVRG